jgi:hypothetical protein
MSCNNFLNCFPNNNLLGERLESFRCLVTFPISGPFQQTFLCELVGPIGCINRGTCPCPGQVLKPGRFICNVISPVVDSDDCLGGQGGNPGGPGNGSRPDGGIGPVNCGVCNFQNND